MAKTLSAANSAWRRVIEASLITCLIVASMTAAVIYLQLRSIDQGAETEARNLARSVAYGAAIHNDDLQAFVRGLDALYRRDIVIVDSHKVGLADSDMGEVGAPFTGDSDNEVGRTIADGQPRAFVETEPEHPEGLKQVTVPLYKDGHADGQIVGAVILESGAVREDLRRAVSGQLYAQTATGVLCILIIAVFGSRLARSMQRQSDELKASREQLLVDREREKAASAQIEFLAFHDRLTGLPNRSMLSRMLNTEIEEAGRRGSKLALFFVDLDRFKNINDTLGHQAGDLLLQQVTQRLKACVRSCDAVTRLGGDEFVVMLPDLHEIDPLKAIAQKLLASIARPLQILGQELHVTASIGISVYPSDGEDEGTLLKNADIAMYQAKEDGKNGFAFYRADLNRHSFERLAFESSLARALDDNQFELHYQPKIECSTGNITGVEALLRWHHPDLGIVLPKKFIPIAEETGLIIPLGRWVLRTACEQHMAWRQQGLPAVSIAVNLSARQFVDEQLLDDVRAVLAETGMAASFLELEVTESVLMRDLTRTHAVMTAFNEMGIRLSVDDFGTGYSSLSNLKRFPVDTIKIDRSFIRDLSTNGDDKAIADAIISMGRTMSLTVIAEGVETFEQAEFLREHGCDQFQGFYASRPIPSDEIATLLTQRQSNAPEERDNSTRQARAARTHSLTPDTTF